MSGEEIKDYRKIKEELNFAFGKPNFDQISWAKILTRRRTANEGLEKFATDLKRLVKLAYSECEDKNRDSLDCSHSIFGITDIEIETIFMLEHVSSL